MGKQSRTAAARAAAVAAGVLLIGSTWTGAALADAPIVSGPEVPVPVTTTTSSPVPAGSVAATRAPAAAPVATAGDKDCRDFVSQSAAQSYFTAIGGSATNNADDLDANHNNIACEDYNYGTSGGASIAGASGGSGQSPAAGPAQVSTVPSGGVNTGDGSFVQ
jgi:hypothetical protein